MSASKFKGVITALVTPFKDGAVDMKSFKNLIKNQLDQGVHGFVINGTTGESPTLTKQEVKDLFMTAKAEVGGQIPLILGTGSNSTVATAEFTKEGSTWGPDGILVVVPYYNKPPQRGLIQHFKTVAAATDKPVILYNVPGRTITSMDAETVGELAKVKNITAIKEATGNMDVLAKIKTQVSSEFTLLSGDDGTVVDFMSGGGHGYNNIEHFANTIKPLLFYKNEPIISTMFDYFGLNSETKIPNYATCISKNTVEERIKCMENSLHEKVISIKPDYPFFLPNILRHEMETLLFADIETGFAFEDEKIRKDLMAICEQYPNIEDINNTPQGAPSKRLDEVFKAHKSSYQKGADAVDIAEFIGINTMLKKAPRFRNWVAQLLHLLKTTP